MCVTVVVMTWIQSVVSFYVLFTYTLVCIYTHLLVYTYKCIYTHLHVYLSTVYVSYKLTRSLYIKKREIIFQEDYVCFPHGKPKLVHFFNISSDIFKLPSAE